MSRKVIYKNSDISTSGNYLKTSDNVYAIDNTFDLSLSKDTDYVLAQVKNYAYYIHSRSIDDRTTADYITSLLKQLPRYQRAAVFYRYGLDLDIFETARRLSCSKTSAAKYLSQAFEQLRNIIEQQ